MARPNLIVENSNMADSLTVIKRNVKQEKKGIAIETKRVAAYCRVSTNLEEQEASLKTQIEAFTRIINNHVDWELVGIYADEGISGTSVDRRIEFQRMIKDADAGKSMLLWLSRFQDSLEIHRIPSSTQDTFKRKV